MRDDRACSQSTKAWFTPPGGLVVHAPRPGRKRLRGSRHGAIVPTRMSDQRRKLEWLSMSRSNAALVLTDRGDLCWREILISNSGTAYEVVITYPPSFPFERPRACIVAPALDHAPHRYVDGTLCLFPTAFDETLSCTAGVIRGRVALWVDIYESWQRTGVWVGPELAH
jgi:hypothetical protein